jgi:hypothetical protein
MKIRWLGLGFGAALTLAGVMVPAVTAQADSGSSCPTYPGAFCTAPSTAGLDGSTPAPVTKAVVVSSGSLAFTGADIEEMTVFGAGALVAGGVLVRRSRRRRLPA